MRSNKMQELVEIFMRRDGMSREEAVDLVCEVRAALHTAIMEEEDPYELFEDLTGLEPDYILDIF